MTLALLANQFLRTYTTSALLLHYNIVHKHHEVTAWKMDSAGRIDLSRIGRSGTSLIIDSREAADLEG